MGSPLSNLSDFDKNLEEIRTFCTKNAKQETCGVVSEKGVHVLTNVSFLSYFFYEIDPLEYKRIRDNHKVLFFWHSHVLGRATPSELDIEYAYNADLPSLIYSLKTNSFSLFSSEYKALVYFTL